MLNISSSKKGVSPLIATILLIAFAVALGSVVMNWGINLDLGKPADRCRNVEIKLRNIVDAEVCFGSFETNSYLNFVIDNTGTIDINGLAIWIIGDKGTRLFDLDNIFIEKGTLYNKNDKGVTYDFSTLGRLKEVQFIPKIKAEQTTEICSKNFVKAEKIGICA